MQSRAISIDASILIEHAGDHLYLSFCCSDLLSRSWLRTAAEEKRHFVILCEVQWAVLVLC